MEANEYLVKFYQMAKKIESVDLFPQKKHFSRTEFCILREVVLERALGMHIISSELSRRLGVTRSAISQTVTKLEKENILVRVPSKTDLKTAYIELSDEALAVFEKQCETANKAFEQIVEEFGVPRMDATLNACNDFYELFKRIWTEKQEKKDK